MPRKPLRGWTRLFAFGAAAAFLTAIGPGNGSLGLRTRTSLRPAVYLLPKIPGGTALHMAMLHDVLLDRYLRHGDAWYGKRNEQSRAVIESHSAPTTATAATAPALDVPLLEAMDDLAVGLESLHHSSEAADVMRKKLALLPPITVAPPKWLDDDRAELAKIKASANLSPLMHHEYTTRANLGTSLIHGSLAAALGGDAAARATLREGLQYIIESIAINPGAHFAREKWQAIAVQHFLAATEKPELLTRFDMIGDDLQHIYVQYHHWGTRAGLTRSAAWIDAHSAVDERLSLRKWIPLVGLSGDWCDAVHPLFTREVPLDEPALGLMGMWMLGGGPNPYSALTLASIANQADQQEIAWDGYERTIELLETSSASGQIHDTLVSYCLERQKTIATTESPSDPDGWQTRTRARHQSELAWAHGYQADYHHWEEKQIAAGVALDNSQFYDAFFESHGSIASRPADADLVEFREYQPNPWVDWLPRPLLAAGIVMLICALFTRRPLPPPLAAK